MEAFLPNLLIALREGVEAALVIGIIVAYLVKVGRRDVLPKLWIAVIIAAIIPLGLGIFWTWGPVTITFQTQEVLGGVFSIIAVGFITWMIFWMGKNSREMTAKLKEKAETALESGNTTALIWMAAIAVFREGAETAIFVWGVVASTQTTSNVWPRLGVVLGLLLAIVIGWLIYRGSVAINLRLFFNVTGYLLIIVAAGVLLYGIGDLQEASVVPGWGVTVYDYSSIINPVAGTWWFVLLRAFFNINYWFYPTHLQLVCYVAYLVIVLVLFTLQIKGIIWTGKKADKGAAKPDQEPVDAMAQELVEKHGEPADAPVDVDGANLSGGQRQRLVFARALLQNASVYVFDEATANIDAESERYLLAVIQKIALSKTVIVISHRLPILRYADEVLVMNAGRVEERGTHAELIAAGGLYRSMWDRSAELEAFAASVMDELPDDGPDEVEEALESMPGMMAGVMRAFMGIAEAERYQSTGGATRFPGGFRLCRASLAPACAPCCGALCITRSAC